MENFEEVVIMNQFNGRSISCNAFILEKEFKGENSDVVGGWFWTSREMSEQQGDREQAPLRGCGSLIFLEVFLNC